MDVAAEMDTPLVLDTLVQISLTRPERGPALRGARIT